MNGCYQTGLNLGNVYNTAVLFKLRYKAPHSNELTIRKQYFILFFFLLAMCKKPGGSWTSTVISSVHYPTQPNPTQPSPMQPNPIQPNPTFPFFQSSFSSGTVFCLPGGTPSSVASVRTNTPVLLSVTMAPGVCHQAGPSNTRRDC